MRDALRGGNEKPRGLPAKGTVPLLNPFFKARYVNEKIVHISPKDCRCAACIRTPRAFCISVEYRLVAPLSAFLQRGVDGEKECFGEHGGAPPPDSLKRDSAHFETLFFYSAICERKFVRILPKDCQCAAHIRTMRAALTSFVCQSAKSRWLIAAGFSPKSAVGGESVWERVSNAVMGSAEICLKKR